MDIKHIIQINSKKLRRRKSSAMFLIVPIALLVSLIIIISSQVANFRAAAKSSIFGTIEEQNKLIELRKDLSQFRGMGFNSEDLYYTENDINVIGAVENVQATQSLSSVPTDSITVSNLFKNIDFSIGQLTGLASDFSALYTDQDFNYKAGQPIPIILNVNNFIEIYEDWGGKDEIAIDMTPMRRNGNEGNREDFQNAFPVKTRVIDYEKDDLINKEITVQFGGLEKMNNYEIEYGESGLIFKKLSNAEVEKKINDRKSEISKYWDCKKISTPLEYKFKVVGIIEDEGDRNTFIPQDFVLQLMQDYVQHQLDARNNVEIPKDDLTSAFVGLQYDGLELGSGTNSFGRPRGFGGGGMMAMRGDVQSGYNIPGLVVEVDREDTSNIIGEYKDSDVYKSSAKNAEVVLIKVNDISNRGQVVDDLNKAGYAYQDLSDAEVFKELESTLNTISTFSIIAFIGLSIVIIIFTMGKFITESKREIGILRALGSTKFDIKKIFIVQAFLYVLIGYIIGVVSGFVLNFLFANPAKAWFDSFIQKTIEESFGVVNPVSADVFFNINLEALAIYSAALFVIVVFTSLIPATKASNMSPVEAIRSE